VTTKLDHPYRIRPLAADEGGGYLIAFPDLPGRISDGETVEEAIAHGADALSSWIARAKEFGDPVPPPSRPVDEAYRGRWNLRVPKSLHRRLAERAKAEGVSLDTLTVTLLAEGLGRRERDGGRPA
jgi:antitoxin HicB